MEELTFDERRRERVMRRSAARQREMRRELVVTLLVGVAALAAVVGAMQLLSWALCAQAGMLG